MKKIVALLTDFGWDDNYVGIIKGVILNINSNLQVVDICHSINPQNIIQGALRLKSAYSYFPKKTVFLCVVDPGVGSKREAVILKTKDYFFVAPDNGLLSLVVDEHSPKEIYTITNRRYFIEPLSCTFHGRDILAPVAAHIASGVPLHRFGKRKEALKKIALPKVIVDHKKQCLQGQIIDIDRFGNCITNLTEKDLAVIKRKVSLKFKGYTVSRIASSYAEAEEDQPLVIVGSRGYLEISVNNGSAAKKFNLRIGTPIKVLPKDSLNLLDKRDI
ncbi:MAG: SAM-dependent chlorinase/fluorinase [Candidatus Omnitrophica bacterium]|nr:SAM-dependent chlorinase/fluorinase [Candidatus Omnitrophota bacterium]